MNRKWYYGLSFIVALLLISSAIWLKPVIANAPSLEAWTFVEATQVFDAQGRLIAKLFEENRTVVPLSQITPALQQAIIANEDSRFYQHLGIDPIGILRALWINLRYGEIREGGSTLTQQLVKNKFLTQEQTWTRKVREAVMALWLERFYTKQEILAAYLNQVYFGEGAYGVESAAQLYFGKSAATLTLSESALLAGIPRSPTAFSPYANMEASLARRQVVLQTMAAQGYITQAEALEGAQTPLLLAGKRRSKASYFLDYIAEQLVAQYGSDRVYRGGLKVYTTLDLNMQQAAEGVLGKNQGAVLVIEAFTGYIRAMVGGRDYQESMRNRVVGEIRQPGSAFKPFVYTQALLQGWQPNSLLIDQPIRINGYAPQNYDQKYRGAITLKKALRLSVNTAAVQLAQQIGMPNVLQLAQQMGIQTIVMQDNHLASALGGLSQGVTLYDMVAAYSAFANAGVISQPIGILRVDDEKGNRLYVGSTVQRAALSPQHAYIMTDMLRGVLESGTGSAGKLDREAAGKTGTTDNYETAWFIGYTPDIVAGIYIGNDNHTPVGISGSQVAGMWGGLMKECLKDIPNRIFPVPNGVVTNIPICSNTGKRAERGCAEVDYMAFLQGNEPPAMIIPETASPLLPGAPSEGKINEKRQDVPRQGWQRLLPRLPRF